MLVYLTSSAVWRGSCFAALSMRSPLLARGGRSSDWRCPQSDSIGIGALARSKKTACTRCKVQSSIGVANLALTGEIGNLSCFLNAADRPKLILPLASPLYSVGSGGRGVSFQITILKVLAGHPQGHASLADLKQYVAVLTCSGADWSQRMKRLAARAPELDIQRLRVTRAQRVADHGERP